MLGTVGTGWPHVQDKRPPVHLGCVAHEVVVQQRQAALRRVVDGAPVLRGGPVGLEPALRNTCVETRGGGEGMPVGEWVT